MRKPVSKFPETDARSINIVDRSQETGLPLLGPLNDPEPDVLLEEPSEPLNPIFKSAFER